MLTLVNGRGRLGNALRGKLGPYKTQEEIYIYHTWQVQDKSKKVQANEFEKLKTFVDQHKEQKIIFVSTTSINETHYVFYKQMAESYILLNNLKSFVIKLPLIISDNSIFTNFKNKNVLAYGTMEFVDLDDAANEVLSMINYTGLNRIKIVQGNKIKAKYIKEIVRL